MTKHEILAINLSSHGYGLSKEEVLNIINKLTEVELDELTYNLYRTSEKLGECAFDCEELYKDKIIF